MTLLGLLCHTHCWLSFSALKTNKSFLILIKAKSFLNVINPVLTKPRDYKLSLPSLFGQDGWILALIFLCVFRKTQKKNSAKI